MAMISRAAGCATGAAMVFCIPQVCVRMGVKQQPLNGSRASLNGVPKSDSNRSMAHRGHTGVEGQSVKACGILAALIVLIWLVLAYLIQDALSALVLPVLLLAAGAVTFFVGRSMAKAHAGSGG